jgi:hypothetical protein
MKKLIIEIYRTYKADFGKGCNWSFIDKFVFCWYRNYIKPKYE